VSRVSKDNGLTGAHHQELTSTMIAPRRPPSSRPFLAAPRTDFYHPARAIDAALLGIERAIRRSEGVGLIVGPPGTGKTLLLAKLAEHVRDDFDVALLSGARICTRRALWQSVLAEIGEPYRGIDEGELRIGVVERVRGLAASGSGLVILVDEAHTLPTRLLEELRLLTNIPTPLPSVHVVLAGTREMDERLGTSRMESLAQRIGARFYLEPLDHEETMAYLRTQMKVAGLQWDAVFERGSDDAVFAATDGVPRLVNQLCDLALVQAGEAGRKRVGPADIASAWRDIQRLPATSLGHVVERMPPAAESRPTVDRAAERLEERLETGDSGAIVEFGSFGDDPAEGYDEIAGLRDGDTIPHGFIEGSEGYADDDAEGGIGVEDESGPVTVQGNGPSRREPSAVPAGNPWSGPEVELVFDGIEDPFAEYFADAERVVERYVVRGPADFSDRRHVASREGASLSRQLPPSDHPPVVTDARSRSTPVAPSAPVVADETDDADMVVIEEDLWMPPVEADRRVIPVRLGDYRRLFARMRRGGSAE
jgi:type II secretory pathway predicted ATPase ExeA